LTHRLVLGAFRLTMTVNQKSFTRLNAPSGAWCFPTNEKIDRGFSTVQAQCTFWCLALSDWGRALGVSLLIDTSQCTFWCLMLSDPLLLSTRKTDPSVSMHLLVLDAFRPDPLHMTSVWTIKSQCTFWCFPTRLAPRFRAPDRESQCTFWCLVLSDPKSSRNH